MPSLGEFSALHHRDVASGVLHHSGLKMHLIPPVPGAQGMPDQRVSIQNCTFLISGQGVAVLMAVQDVSIKFSGYWSEYNRGLMPRRAGVFCVYRAHFNDLSKSTTMLELLYIGGSPNVHECLAEHRLADQWRACLGPDDSLSFSFGSVALPDLAACETALVMQHRPRCNEAVPQVFPFDGLSLKLTHRTPLLQGRFSIGAGSSGVMHRLSGQWVRRGLDFLRGIQPG